MANSGVYGDPNVHTTFTGDATLVQAAAAQATAAVSTSASAQAESARLSAAAIEAASARASEAWLAQTLAAREAAAATGSQAPSSFASSAKAALQPLSALASVFSRTLGLIGLVTGGISLLGYGFKKYNEEIEKSRTLTENVNASLDKIAGKRQFDFRTSLVEDLLGNKEEQAAIRQATDEFRALREDAEKIREPKDRAATLERIRTEQELRVEELNVERHNKEIGDQIQQRIDTTLKLREGLKALEDASAKPIFDGATASEFERVGELITFGMGQSLKRSQFAEALKEAADEAAQRFADQVAEALAEVRRLNESFVNSQNSSLITSINRLTDTLNATGGVGRFDGPETGFR